MLVLNEYVTLKSRAAARAAIHVGGGGGDDIASQTMQVRMQLECLHHQQQLHKAPKP